MRKIGNIDLSRDSIPTYSSKRFARKHLDRIQLTLNKNVYKACTSMSWWTDFKLAWETRREFNKMLTAQKSHSATR